MKAIVQDRFGPPDVLRLSDTGVPEAGPDDVLVRVHAAALNPGNSRSGSVKAGWIVASAVDGVAVVIGHLPAGLEPEDWACSGPSG